MTDKNKSLMQIHLAVLLFGLSGLFGKFITLPPIIIVSGRVCFSSAFLFIVIKVFKRGIRLKEKRHYLYLIIMGGFWSSIGLHFSKPYKCLQ